MKLSPLQAAKKRFGIEESNPTLARKAVKEKLVDAVQKLTGGKPILSREGGWDELGWSEARKARERDLLKAEEADPVLERVTRELINAGTASSG